LLLLVVLLSLRIAFCERMEVLEKDVKVYPRNIRESFSACAEVGQEV